MKRLIVCDFDGTLYVNKDERRMLKALDSLKDLPPNIVFALASGRPLHLLKPYLDNYPDIYIISNDGALITKDGNIIYQNPISKDLLENICTNKAWCCYGECISYIHYKDTITGLKWRKMFSNHAVFAEKVSDVKENIYKIFFNENITEIQGLKKCYKSYGISEFSAQSADKGKAVLALSDMLGVSTQDITVFGDGENDIPMFEIAGRSFAYKYAPPNVRARAKFEFYELDFRNLMERI